MKRMAKSPNTQRKHNKAKIKLSKHLKELEKEQQNLRGISIPAF
jgi:fructose-bisphosphate aldolase class 1